MDPAQKHLVLISARQFAERLATAMFVGDATGKVVYYNEAAEQLLGRRFREAGEMKTGDWPAFFKPEYPDGSPVPLDQMPAVFAMNHRKPAHLDFRITGLDGKRRMLSVTSFPLLARAGELVGFVSIFWEEPDAG